MDNIAKADISIIKLKNSSVNLENYLIPGEVVQYITWSRDTDLSIDYDIILTNKRMIVISSDYVDCFTYRKISHLHIYYGDLSENYPENYMRYTDDYWRFGTGTIYVLFGLDNSDNFAVCFTTGRFEKAKQLYLELSKLWLEHN